MKTSKALVFDIKRFAVHDGQGIRTTIFFKGCPLRCKWCQNPEGLEIERRPIYLENNCIHCKICAQYKQIQYNERPYFISLDHFDDIVDECPSGAIRYDSEYYTIEELLDEIKKDQVFFREEGGVTFSGGESLLQGEFLLELLKRCKQEGINTAIETTMYGSLDLIKQILPYLDTIYIDMKLYDDKEHIKYTNVSNKQIKEHISYILKSEHKDKVIIRTPLIPHITATDQNLTGISQFIANLYDNVSYELLNYNPLAPSKYKMVSKTYELSLDYKPFTKEEMDHFYQILTINNIKNIIKE